MEIVQSINGKYAIRRRSFWFWWEYLDLKYTHYWWPANSSLFSHCWGTLEQVEKFEYLSSKDIKVIKKIK